MYFRRVLWLVLACLTLAGSGDQPATTQSIKPVTLFVSVDGKGANDGTIDRPLASLEQARDRLRMLKTVESLGSGAVVYVRGGTYERSAPFELTQEDSGTPAAPVLYAAYPGETVRLVGGRRLKASWFETVSANSPVWDRIHPSARGKMMQVDLPSHGIRDFGWMVPRAGWAWNGNSSLELFFDSEPMELGRWPGEGFAIVAGTPDGRFGKTLTYSGTGPGKWKTKNVRVGGLFGSYWFYSQVDATIDPARKLITLSGCPPYGLKAGRPFVLWNVLEEVARPGQWYLDRQSGILYFWPPEKLDGADIFVSMLEDVLLKLTKVSNVKFQDMVFEIARGGIVRIEGGSGNRLINCIIRNSGTYGSFVSGTDNGLEDCLICNTGERGVTLDGGDRATLRPGGNFVRNTEIHHWGRIVRTSKAAVHLEGVGQIVSNCLLHDAPHTAIWYYGNNHVIERNDIHHVCRETADAGAIYSGRSWGHQGIVIRNNFIHDCASIFTPEEIYGVYMDDAVSAATVEGNIFYRIAGAATFNAGGRDNRYLNNIFVKCLCAHLADRRGMDIINDKPGNDCNFLEILNRDSGGNYQKGPWSAAYPALARIPNDYRLMSQGGFKNPGGCVFAGNIGFDNKAWTKEGHWGGYLGALRYYHAIRDNIQNADPMFMDESGGNFSLRPDSPAHSIPGWLDIPFDQIGIRRSK